MRVRVSVQEPDFDVAAQQRDLLEGRTDAGAVASFVGLVRADNLARDVVAMELEHYPGMTERSISDIVEEAGQRWAVQAATVIHRVGRLRPGEQIVYVGVASAHRGDAFAACEFIMDYLKTRAPFWKKEFTGDGEHWVDARDSDTTAAQRWAE